MSSNFWNDAVDTGKRFLNCAGEKSAEWMEKAKVKLYVSELKSSVNAKYKKLGRLAAEQMDRGRLEISQPMQRLYNEICEQLDQIDLLSEDR
mgnify:CR=1 FL=1